MPFLSSGKRRFWLVALAAAGATALAIGAAAMSLAYLRQSWGVLRDAREEMGALEAHRLSVTRAAETLRALESELALLRPSFADAADPLPFIEAIEALGRRRGVALELAVSGGAAEYRLSASGSFAATMAFLRAVELLPFLVTAGDLEMVRSGESSAGVARPPREEIRLGISLRTVPLP